MQHSLIILGMNPQWLLTLGSTNLSMKHPSLGALKVFYIYGADLSPWLEETDGVCLEKEKSWYSYMNLSLGNLSQTKYFLLCKGK